MIEPADIDLATVCTGDSLSCNGQVGEVVGIQQLGERWEVRLAIDGVGIRTMLSPPNTFQKIHSPEQMLKSGSIGSAMQWFLRTEALRLSLAYQHDRLVSLSNSRTQLEPYQVDAVHKVMTAWEQRFLIADDVGLGKTVEAGMIVKELKARHRGDSVLIIAPAGLTIQWQREMREKFDESFDLLTSRIIKQWEQARPHGEKLSVRYSHAIVSVDTAKERGDGSHTLHFTEANWDIVVIDEAHKVAQSGRGTELSNRHKLGRDVAQACDALLLLSATPHNGDSYSFHSLISLLDDQRFPEPEDIDAQELEPMMVRRSKHDILDDDGKPLFPPRSVETTEVQFSGDEMHLYEQVTDYVREGYKMASEQRDTAIGFPMVLLQKRMVSSICAIKRSLERRLIALKHPEAAVLSPSELREIHRFDEDEEGFGDDERAELQEKLIEARLVLTDDQHKLEIKRVAHLVDLAKQITVDSKAQELRKFVADLFARSDDEKLLIFTEYSDTLDYLRDEILKEFGPLAMIHGGMDGEERQRQEAMFREPEYRIMLATDAAGEGLNLQFCHLMINYELPWNPNRIEQRIGRLHRYGQKRDVRVYNLQVTNTREGYILSKLIDKIHNIEKQLGGYSPNILGLNSVDEAVNLNKLSDLIMDAIAADTPPSVTAELIEKALEERRVMSKRVQADLFQPLKKFDKARIDRVIERMQSGSPTSDDVELFVRSFVSDNGGVVENTKDKGVVRIKTPDRIQDGRTIPDKIERATFHKEVAYSVLGRNMQFLAFGHPMLNLIIDQCISNAHLGQGVVSALRASDIGLEEKGLIVNYLLRVSDSQDTSVLEELVPIHVNESGNAKLLGFDFLRNLGTRLRAGLSGTEMQKLAEVQIDRLLELAREEAIKAADHRFAELTEEYTKKAEVSLRNIRDFQNAKNKRLNGAITAFRLRQSKGEDMEIAIRRKQYEIEQLEKSCKRRIALIESKSRLQQNAPSVVNIAIVQ